MKKEYEVHLTEAEYRRFESFMLLLSRFLVIYDEHPDMEVIIKTKPKKRWQFWK